MRVWTGARCTPRGPLDIEEGKGVQVRGQGAIEEWEVWHMEEAEEISPWKRRRGGCGERLVGWGGNNKPWGWKGGGTVAPEDRRTSWRTSHDARRGAHRMTHVVAHIA